MPCHAKPRCTVCTTLYVANYNIGMHSTYITFPLITENMLHYLCSIHGALCMRNYQPSYLANQHCGVQLYTYIYLRGKVGS